MQLIAIHCAMTLFMILGLAPAFAQQAIPQCQFFNSIAVGPVVTARGGGTLSPYKMAPDPTVIKVGSTYHMWFTNSNSKNQTGIAYAKSKDGLTWDVYSKPKEKDPVMDLVLTAPSDGWDTPGLETANVVVGPDGIFRMYYSGNHVPAGSVTYAIGMATSTDGVVWQRRAAPVLEASALWEQPKCSVRRDPNTCTVGGVLEPSVLYDPVKKLYKMWYAGLGEPSNSFRTFRIGYAESPDGVQWTRQPQPVFELGAKDAWDELWTSHVNVVADPVAGYHMFYFGSAAKDYKEGIEMQRGSIGHAFSLDGVHWQRDPSNPLITPRPSQVDAWSVGGPTAIIEEGTLKLWYFASPNSGLESSIVYATADCGTHSPSSGAPAKTPISRNRRNG